MPSPSPFNRFIDSLDEPGQAENAKREACEDEWDDSIEYPVVKVLSALNTLLIST